MVSISQAAWDAIVVENVGLKERLAEAEQDAARYRWLRENGDTVDFVADSDNRVRVWKANNGICYYGKTLDEAIDAATADSADQEGVVTHE